eukprot:gene111-150_t
MDSKFKLRLKWINLDQQLGNAGKVCEHYGIPRFTLRKWIKRYQQQGEDGLLSLSSQPTTFPLQKRDATNEQLILGLRSERKSGARRIQSELNRLHNIAFSLSTIHKVLIQHTIKPLILKRHYRKKVKRYNCKYPGERIQMDVCQISKQLYQYTAIDDYTRYKVIALNSRGYCQLFGPNLLKELKIKFRPIKPASPHLNGKVERTQHTDLDEFYSSINMNDPQLEGKLKQWEEYYNTQRPHRSLQGKTPFEQYKSLEKLTRSEEDIRLAYDQSQEIIPLQNYNYDQIIRAFKERIFEEEQEGKERADYGTYLIKYLSKQLQPEFGSGFSYRQLYWYSQFYRTFQIVSTLWSQLSWSLNYY